MKQLEQLLEWGGMKRDIVFLILSGAALLVSIFDLLPLPFDAAWVAIILCGIPIVLEAVIGLVTAFDIKADVLVSMALIASVIIGEDFAAGEVAFIMQLGSLLEELTVARARAGIEKLVHLTPQTARVISGDRETVLPAEQVKIGDVLRVLPGETVPVDGVILSGQTSINQAVMTGESLPVDKTAGDEVSSGTVNQFGSFDMKATRVGEDSSIQRMIRLVQSADAGKAKIVGIADRWATWIVVIALAAAALTWLISGEVIRAVTILVVFCPCALVLATPTAIMAAIGNATKHGFLVREGDALERLAAVRRVAFDKTGTLTRGVPEVTEVRSVLPDYPPERLYALAAAAELRSEHPLGRAVVRCWKQRPEGVALQQPTGIATLQQPTGIATLQQSTGIASPQPGGIVSPQPRGIALQQPGGIASPQPEEFRMLPGRGVSARVGGLAVLAGNLALLEEAGIRPSEELLAQAGQALDRGCTVIYLAVEGRAAGFLALADALREESAGMIAGVQALGVRPVLLTGDHESAARSIAGSLGIQEVHASCLPEEKLRWIASYQEKQEPVCMIGDGINDAPALKRAEVGIAMGGVGSDIAVDAADIALVDDEIRELPHLLALSRRMMLTIKCNLSFSMALNFLAIILAITGILNPVVGALVHNAGSVLVILNSAFLLTWRRKHASSDT